MAAVRRSPLIVLLLVISACAARPEGPWPGAGERIADGVDLFRTADQTLVDGAGPIAICLLRLDPGQVTLASVLSNDQVIDAEDVAAIATRHHALAAVNGGFFNRANGEPLGLLKTGGQLVSDAGLVKGAVLIRAPESGPMSLSFDQAAAKMMLHFSVGGQSYDVPIDGVDTTRERGRLMLYTPAYHEDTDTAPTGTEWVLEGKPLRVTTFRPGAGHSRIPRGGAVLSFGGTTLPPALAVLQEDVEVTMTTSWRSANDTPAEAFEAADHIVGGAGLLRRHGIAVADWRPEGLTPEAFTSVRHPRTMIGVDAEHQVWLVAVDGRFPDYSIGMTFGDLQRLADRLRLTDALNLDGGGSTTMVVRGQIVNRPSDPTGPRPVGDALLVMPRGRVE